MPLNLSGSGRVSSSLWSVDSDGDVTLNGSVGLGGGFTSSYLQGVVGGKTVTIGGSSEASSSLVLKDDDGVFDVATTGGTFRIYDDNLERMRIDTGGEVRMPYQPAINVRMGTSQSIDHLTQTKVNFDTIDNQNGSNYSTADKRFTAPVDGYYLINTHVYIYSVEKAEVRIHKNGSIYLRHAGTQASTNVNPNGAELHHAIKLSAGDYIEIYAYQSSGGTQTIYNSAERPTYLSIVLLN